MRRKHYNWEPRKAMTLYQYMRFKLGKWAKAESVPKWVHEKHQEKYDHHSGTHKDTYTGTSLVYEYELDDDGVTSIRVKMR